MSSQESPDQRGTGRFKQVTNFTSENIWNYALSRGHSINDIVLIKDFRKSAGDKERADSTNNVAAANRK